jgi:hypothetical protein
MKKMRVLLSFVVALSLLCACVPNDDHPGESYDYSSVVGNTSWFQIHTG